MSMGMCMKSRLCNKRNCSEYSSALSNLPVPEDQDGPPERTNFFKAPRLNRQMEPKAAK